MGRQLPMHEPALRTRSRVRRPSLRQNARQAEAGSAWASHQGGGTGSRRLTMLPAPYAMLISPKWSVDIVVPRADRAARDRRASHFGRGELPVARGHQCKHRTPLLGAQPRGVGLSTCIPGVVCLRRRGESSRPRRGAAGRTSGLLCSRTSKHGPCVGRRPHACLARMRDLIERGN